MIVRSGIYIKKVILSLLILTGLAEGLYSQDKKIGDIVNIYRRVTEIGTSPRDNVTLSDAIGISTGDTVLLIQMKGANILTDEGSSFGTQQGYRGAPGMSEFLIVLSVSGSNVVFTSIINNSFDTDGIVQLIKVPYYNSATVTSTLTCQPWDSVTKTGGVLAMIIGRTLILESDIDVSGKGFKGGIKSEGDRKSVV